MHQNPLYEVYFILLQLLEKHRLFQQIFLIISVIFFILDLNTQTGASTYGPSTQPEAYFNGSSYLRLQTSISLKKLTGLSFRTCYGKLLLYISITLNST